MPEWGDSHQRLSEDRIRTIMRVHRQIWNRVVEHVPPPALFFDVGPGTVGSEAWGAQRDWPSTRIVGFEPCGERYNILKRGDYPGVLYRMAVCEIDGDVPILMGDEYWQSILAPPIEPEEEKYYEKTTVESITLDRAIEYEESVLKQDIPSVFIWADIEGSELRMLQGARRLLASGRVVGLNLEVRRERPAKGWCTAEEVESLLHQYDFEVAAWGQDWLFLPKT